MKTVNKFWDNFYKNFNLRKPTGFGKFVNKNFFRKKKKFIRSWMWKWKRFFLFI